MKKSLSVTCILVTLALGVFAQVDSSTRPLTHLRKDYNQVGIVAHVKINSIKFAAADVHPLYVAHGEFIEQFKGKIKRGQPLVLYFHAEEGSDVNSFQGEWIVFLEGKYPIPPGGKGWYELENSRIPASKTNIATMRRIRYPKLKR